MMKVNPLEEDEMELRPYKTIHALRAGEPAEVEGVIVKMDGDGTVSAGDSYVAERNTGPKLLIAERIDVENGFIIPTSLAYCFSIKECVKACEA